MTYNVFGGTLNPTLLLLKFFPLSVLWFALFVWLLAYKPYKSAYDKDSAPANKQYYCEVCEKQLNGPQPYNAHMKSKAHREELEAAGIYA